MWNHVVILPSIRKLPNGTCGQGVNGRLMCIPKNVGWMGPGAFDEAELMGLPVRAEEENSTSRNTRMQEFFIVDFPAVSYRARRFRKATISEVTICKETICNETILRRRRFGKGTTLVVPLSRRDNQPRFSASEVRPHAVVAIESRRHGQRLSRSCESPL